MDDIEKNLITPAKLTEMNNSMSNNLNKNIRLFVWGIKVFLIFAIPYLEICYSTIYYYILDKKTFGWILSNAICSILCIIIGCIVKIFSDDFVDLNNVKKQTNRLINILEIINVGLIGMGLWIILTSNSDSNSITNIVIILSILTTLDQIFFHSTHMKK
jgi:hypothetical protein